MKKKFDFDLMVLGAGTAGCHVALKAATKKTRVAIIESEKWGGSDLNYTHVPFGALFEATQLLQNAVAGSRFGISSKTLRFNYPSLRGWKNLALRRAKANSKEELEEAGITCLNGRAHFISPHEVSDGDKIWRAKKILITTGAGVLDTGIDIPSKVGYLTPADVLNISRLPKSVFVVGAGPTGCEIAQYFAALGVNVTLADYAERLMPREEEEVSQVLEYVFGSQKIKVLTQSRVIAVGKEDGQKRVVFLRGGLEKSVKVDEVVLCTGSAPNTDIGLENAGVEYDFGGITVSDRMQTSIKHIFAAGDVTGGHSTPEKTLRQAEIVALSLRGKHDKKYDHEAPLIRVTNIYPQIAEVGMTEDDCVRRDKHYIRTVLPLGEVAKSNIADFGDGFIKIICDRKGMILGATIMAPHAALLIQELAFAMHHEMNIREIAEMPHLQYEWSELVREAAKQF